MLIYNTLTRKKEKFVPRKENEVSMYVCGPTVYGFIHIGNARPLIVFDTFRKYLEHMGYKVNYIQNFTDIDDKVINRANDENLPYYAIANRYIDEYYIDADALSVKHPTNSPRATEHINHIIELVQTLIDKQHAYVAENGDVYFSVRSFSEYGKLSGQSLDDLESGARIDPTEQKKDPLDFALWKSAKPGEPSWDSPWGKGRPGWHIECSAMSLNILGEGFDIHAGGVDLVFPHHENEIAQSEAATGKCFAKYWMHNGHININNQKMSKSKGNFFTVRDILSVFEPDVVRLFMLSSHYRSPMNFTKELLEQTEPAIQRLRTAKERLLEAKIAEQPTEGEPEFIEQLNEFKTSFEAAMSDDLNTADAIGVLFDFVRACNSFVNAPRSKQAIDAALNLFNTFTYILGILQKEKEAEIPKEALELLALRNEARANKNWAEADRLRDALKDMGYAVEDSKEGAKLKKL
ncbi:MAG TPA: cysteine--tRNA ligase [Clostridiales bacterium]|jgi:cysteinyl-tRNA synthetase|nr:cysteine--tRNA ligase [Clostridiales bacterium]